MTYRSPSFSSSTPPLPSLFPRRRKGILFLFWLFSSVSLLACGGRGGQQREPVAPPPPGNAGEVMARSADGELAYIEKYIGKRPSEVDLWQSEPLQARLRTLLGNDFDTFVEIMQEAGPLTRDQVVYTVGVAPDDAIPGVGYLLIDTERDLLKAYAVFGDLVIDVQTAGASLTVPAAVAERVKAVMGR